MKEDRKMRKKMKGTYVPKLRKTEGVEYENIMGSLSTQILQPKIALDLAWTTEE